MNNDDATKLFAFFCAACVVFIVIFAICWGIWGPPTKGERIERLEDRVEILEQSR